MGLPKLKTKISVEDYLEGEKISPVRREYVNGEVYTMPDAGDMHSRIIGNISTSLNIHLRNSPCETFSRDLKIRATQNIFYYPDILVSCEENPESPYFRNQPILVVEVADSFTEETDRREKLLFYLQILSVQEYAIVDQKKMAVEVHRRQPEGRWITYYFDESDDIVEFTSVELSLPLTEIYRRVKFDSNNAGTIDY